MTKPHERPVLLQLWTVRRELSADFEGTIDRIKGLGFAGVEPYNDPSVSPSEQARIIRAAGLDIPAAHLPLPLGDAAEGSLAAARELGVNWLVSGFGPEDFADPEGMMVAAERANEAAANAEAAGFGFALHNHWWEFGGNNWEQFTARLSSAVKFEIDTYWVQVAGRDPARLLAELGSRVPLVHLKDGPALRGAPMLALGQGVMDIPALLDSTQAQFLIVELDEHDGDMLGAVRDSMATLMELQVA